MLGLALSLLAPLVSGLAGAALGAAGLGGVAGAAISALGAIAPGAVAISGELPCTVAHPKGGYFTQRGPFLFSREQWVVYSQYVALARDYCEGNGDGEPLQRFVAKQWLTGLFGEMERAGWVHPAKLPDDAGTAARLRADPALYLLTVAREQAAMVARVAAAKAKN